MLNLLKNISRATQIDNVQDATIHKVNRNGTYDLVMRTGAIKKQAFNATELQFQAGDRVNISLVTGTKESAKIIGKGFRTKIKETQVRV